MAKTKEEKDIASFIKQLAQQRKVLGMIKFERGKDIRVTEWESFTKNLVIYCFGQKSNQLKQFERLFESFENEYHPIKKEIFVIKMKGLLANFIKELKLSTSQNIRSTDKTTIAPRFHQTAIQTTNIKIEQTIENIIRVIREKEPDEAKALEAEKYLNEFKEEIKKDSPVWANVKNILVWLLNFSRDTFLQILPYLLEKYNK